jgi:hypothetical protein
MKVSIWEVLFFRILCFRAQILFQAVIVFSLYLYITYYFLSPTWPCDLRTNTGAAANVRIPFILLINARNECSQQMEFLKCRVKNRLKFSSNIVTMYADWKCPYGMSGTHRGCHHTVPNTVVSFYVFILKLKRTEILLWVLHIVICFLCYCTMFLIILSRTWKQNIYEA